MGTATTQKEEKEEQLRPTRCASITSLRTTLRTLTWSTVSVILPRNNTGLKATLSQSNKDSTYWLSLEGERVSSSQAHSSLSSVTVEKHISLIKHSGLADDSCLAGRKLKPPAHMEYLHNQKTTPGREAADDNFRYSGQALRVFGLVFNLCATVLRQSSSHTSYQPVNYEAGLLFEMLG